MKNKNKLYNLSIRFFQALVLLLLVFLIISTFIPQRNEFPAQSYPGKPSFLLRLFFLDRFYDSPLNAALWFLLSLAMIVAVPLKILQNSKQKILHLLLALLFLGVAADKSFNKRFMISIPEGKVQPLYLQHFPEAQNIELQSFEILLHEDEQTPRAFRSYLNINGEKDLLLEVNKPVALGPYRLYQSAYQELPYYLLRIGEREKMLSFGDSLHYAGSVLVLEAYDSQSRRFLLRSGKDFFELPLLGGSFLLNSPCSIRPLGLRYLSIIEVVEVRGLRLLLFLSVLYLAVILIDFRLFHKARGVN